MHGVRPIKRERAGQLPARVESLSV